MAANLDMRLLLHDGYRIAALNTLSTKLSDAPPILLFTAKLDKVSKIYYILHYFPFLHRNIFLKNSFGN